MRKHDGKKSVVFVEFSKKIRGYQTNDQSRTKRFRHFVEDQFPYNYVYTILCDWAHVNPAHHRIYFLSYMVNSYLLENFQFLLDKGKDNIFICSRSY